MPPSGNNIKGRRSYAEL